MIRISTAKSSQTPKYRNVNLSREIYFSVVGFFPLHHVTPCNEESNNWRGLEAIDKISSLVQTLLSCLNFLLSALDCHQKWASLPISSMLYVDHNASIFISSNQLLSLLLCMGVPNVAVGNKTATIFVETLNKSSSSKLRATANKYQTSPDSSTKIDLHFI